MRPRSPSRLPVAHGTLTLASTLGLSFGAGDGTADATMTFSGTAAAINAALGSGLTYNPNANFNGSDSIAVFTTDNGQTGTGPAQHRQRFGRGQHHRDQRRAGGDRRRHRNRDDDQRGHAGPRPDHPGPVRRPIFRRRRQSDPQWRRLLAGPVLGHRGDRQRLQRRDRPVAIFQRRRVDRHRRRLRRGGQAARRSVRDLDPLQPGAQL